jgi:hypothetical protein
LEDLSITAGDHTTGLMQRKIFFVVVWQQESSISHPCHFPAGSADPLHCSGWTIIRSLPLLRRFCYPVQFSS